MDQAGLSLRNVAQWIKVDEMDRKCMKMDQIENLDGPGWLFSPQCCPGLNASSPHPSPGCPENIINWLVLI